jgi:glycosyltransferase involved in cell wall biosynthesis
VNKNKTITLISNNYWTLYKFRFDIVDNFINQGYSINLIAKKDDFHDKFTNKNIKKYFIPLTERGINIFNEIKTFYYLYKIYKNINSDLSFHFTIKPNIYASIISSFFKIKTISFITGIGHIFINKKLFLKKIIIMLYKYSLKNCLEVWFTNKHDKELFIKNGIIKNQSTRIVPGAGAIINENPGEYEDHATTIFLMVSRLHKEKGVIEFLQSAREYKNNNKVNFILIGDLDDSDSNSIKQSSLQSYINDNSITHYGYQNNIKEFLKKSSCIIHPSYREGISTIIIEAAALKIPVITTSVPGCMDIILDESYGILCQPQNTKSLKMSIRKFLNTSYDDKINMTNKTFNFVKNNFNRKDIIKTYDSALKFI